LKGRKRERDAVGRKEIPKLARGKEGQRVVPPVAITTFRYIQENQS